MNTVIHVKTDRNIKQKAQKTAEKLGLSLSAVINVQLRQFVKNKELYISEETRPFSKKFERELQKIDADIRSRKKIVGPFKSAKEAIAYLNS